MKDFNTKLTEYCISRIKFDSIYKASNYTRYTFTFNDDIACLLHWEYREHPYSIALGGDSFFVHLSHIPKILAEKLGYERL
jgi:hypothetical protein